GRNGTQGAAFDWSRLGDHNGHMTGGAWVNGVLIDPAAPALSPTNHGFMLGDGVFETIAIRDGGPFALTRHLARLHASLDRMSLGRVDSDRLRDAVHQVVDAGQGSYNRIRITVTAGDAPPGLSRGSAGLSIVVVGA